MHFGLMRYMFWFRCLSQAMDFLPHWLETKSFFYQTYNRENICLEAKLTYLSKVKIDRVYNEDLLNVLKAFLN